MLKDSIRRALRVDPHAHELGPGLHHFMREVDGRLVRFHLRVDADGSGVVVANATAVAALSPTGMIIASALLAEDAPQKVVEKRMINRFRGAAARDLRDDVTRVKALLAELADPRGRFPFVRRPPANSTRPWTADLTADKPKRLRKRLRSLWDGGIVHVVLIPGEDGITDALVSLVEHAEDLGLITGVRAHGKMLTPSKVSALAKAGLDHLDVTYIAPEPSLHDSLLGTGDHALAEKAITAARDVEVCATAIIPIVDANLDLLDETAARLVALDVPSATVFAIARADEAGMVRQLAVHVDELADGLDLDLVWAPAVLRPDKVALSTLVEGGPRTGSMLSMRIEPDGAILMPMGPATSRGSLTLRDPAWLDVGRPGAARERCEICPELPACQRGCVADPVHWAHRPNDPDDDRAAEDAAMRESAEVDLGGGL